MKNLATNQLIFNESTIPCPIEEGHRMIPVKTVCTVIDINFKDQDSWLKNHEYFSQLYRLSQGSSADNKVRKMNCLPVFDMLSWLSCLSTKNRKPGSMEKQYAFMTWLRSKMVDMYKLIEIFQDENKYELELMNKKTELIEKLEDLNQDARDVKKQISQIDKAV